MNEFVTLCARDRVPVIWFQDTTGIDVGDIAEKAELLAIGQSLVYSIQNADIPMNLFSSVGLYNFAANSELAMVSNG